MTITTDTLRAELGRLRELREKTWADLNQMIGAERQLQVLLEQVERTAPATSDPATASPDAITT